MLVGKRRALLNYLKDRDIARYRAKYGMKTKLSGPQLSQYQC